MKQLFSMAMIITAISCNQKSKETATSAFNAPDSVQKAIQAKLDHQTESINKYDAAGCSEFFTDYAIVVEYLPEVNIINGRKEIDSTLKEECDMFRQQKAIFDIKWETNSLRLAGDMVYHDASVVYTMTAEKSEPVKVSEDALIAWKKIRPGEWRVHTVSFHLR
jgi:ketosteroid isomerase-like protein